ncbi:MAG TPA: ATP-binding protein [bacterium]|nr:ATP-binding protein [bacterium]HQI49328.1 ATP-binding protein [bacterium]HQJ64696.1 ATP-binding protein [bacterium]
MKIEQAHILVVDDEFGMREGIRRLFEAQGHRVETAETGRSGIEKGTAEEFDIYFIDLRIGDLDGVEVLGAIKEKYPEAICVICTAYASIETAVETTRLGAYHYIAKPFAPEEIQLVFDRALERRWYILEARQLRREQERRLLEIAQEKSRIRTIINSIADGIVVLNQDAEVVLFNPQFPRLLDLKQELVLGRSIREVLPDNLQEIITDIFNRKDRLQGLQQEFVIHPPAKLVVMANTTPIRDDQNHVLGYVSVLRDISELKQLELLKSQFVNMAAHELKAPITAIQGYLEMVVEKSLGEEPEVYDGYLRRSLERSKSLISLINDLLNISRIQAGKVRREIERLDLSAQVQSASDFFANEIEKNGLSLKLHLAQGLMIDADREEIQRVLTNLISNAIKYNRPQGSILLQTSREKGYAQLTVQDTGIGMKPEEKERLFEEFFRAKNPHTRSITGTGLGLTLVKKIIDSYAGRIQAESVYEHGTTFTVSFPLADRKESPEN